jgi:hypothetical protein
MAQGWRKSQIEDKEAPRLQIPVIKRSLKIIKCSDSLMWYNKLVGQVVPYVREYDDCYMSREPAGYLNIVKLEDAEIIDEEIDDGREN